MLTLQGYLKNNVVILVCTESSRLNIAVTISLAKCFVLVDAFHLVDKSELAVFSHLIPNECSGTM